MTLSLTINETLKWLSSLSIYVKHHVYLLYRAQFTFACPKLHRAEHRLKMKQRFIVSVSFSRTFGDTFLRENLSFFLLFTSG